MKIEDIEFNEEIKPFNRNNIKFLNGVSGVYFMFDENESLLYIGKANNLFNRLQTYLGSHHLIHCLDISRVKTLRILRIEKDELIAKEKFYISSLIPPFNYAETDGLSERYLSRPHKEGTTVTLCIDEDLVNEIKAMAKAECRSFSGQLVYLAKKGKEAEYKDDLAKIQAELKG